MDSNTIDSIKVAEKLWDLANLVTGFAAAQSIATTFTMAKGELRSSLKGSVAHWAAFGSTVLFTSFYLCVIVWCHEVGSSRDLPASSSVWLRVTIGRVVTVLLFTSVTLVTLYGHRKDELKGQSSHDSRLRTLIELGAVYRDQLKWLTEIKPKMQPNDPAQSQILAVVYRKYAHVVQELESAVSDETIRKYPFGLEAKDYFATKKDTDAP